MGTRVHYSEYIKWQAIKMKQEGYTTKAVMESLNVKNRTQIQTWMRWYKQGQTHQFNQPIGKQYTYNKNIYEYSELDLLKLENKQLKTRLAILAKFQGLQRR